MSVPEPSEIVGLPGPELVIRASHVVILECLVQRRHVAQRELTSPEGSLPEYLAKLPQVLPHLALQFRGISDVLSILGVDEQRPEHV